MDYKEAKYYFENTIDGIEATILLGVVADDDVKQGIDHIKKLTSCDDQTAKLIWCDLKMEYGTKENNPIIQAREEHQQEKLIHEYNTTPHCPKCGSTSITTGARGVNFTWGFIGASKTVNRCANCGHTWKP